MANLEGEFSFLRRSSLRFLSRVIIIAASAGARWHIIGPYGRWPHLEADRRLFANLFR